MDDKSHFWRDFFANLYASGKEFYVRSGYGSLLSLELRRYEVKHAIHKTKQSDNNCTDWEQEDKTPVLDIGCGIGNFVDILPGNYFGIDFSREALAEHREKYKKSVVLGDILNLPFRSGSFSLCIAIEVSQYVRDHEKLMKEISRVMKDGATCIIISPNPDSLFWNIRQKIKGRSPLSFISSDKLTEIAKKFGLEKVEIRGILPFPVLPPLFFPLKIYLVFAVALNSALNSIFPLRNFIVRNAAKSFVIIFQKKGKQKEKRRKSGKGRKEKVDTSE